MGEDLSRVRLHTGAESSSLNEQLNARAFTTGNDVVFGKGEYNPGSETGQKLLSHELGHVVMHRIPTENLEEEANEFAAEFLMPKVDIINELRPFSLPRAVALKSKWRVSIAAIVKRAYDLGVISNSKYTSLFREINYRGMRMEEPVSLPNESPSLFKRVVETYQKQLEYTLEDICKVLKILPKQFMKYIA